MASPPPERADAPTHGWADLTVLAATLGLSCTLAAGWGVGVLSPAAALWGALLAWLAAACWLAIRLRAGERLAQAESERAASLQAAQHPYGIAEDLGAFGTWIVDRNGALVWSTGAFRLYGVPTARGEPSLRDFARRIHVTDRERWIRLVRGAFHEGGEIAIEYRFSCEDGRSIWVRSVGRAQRDARGQVARIAGIAQEITGIRAMQHRLATSEAKFREFTHMSSDWTWETDATHRWAEFSEGAEPVLGRWIGTLKGRPFWEPGDGRFAFRQPDWQRQRERMASRAPFEDFEFAVVDPGGTARFLSLSGRAVIDKTGNFVGYRGVGREITREKEQRMLLECESRFATIMREDIPCAQLVSRFIETLCTMLGWLGGVNLVPTDTQDTYRLAEHWGDACFGSALAAMPAERQCETGSPETRSFASARALWMSDVFAEPGFARRWQAGAAGAEAALLVPITNEHGRSTSTLLFLSPVGFTSSSFVERIAEILSRNLSLFLSRKAAEDRILHQSLHDALTGLPNRVHLTRRLEAMLAQGGQAAVLYIDLDRYKLINDTLGHSVGDQALVEVATRLKDAIRPGDLAGRIGGDEFILLLATPVGRPEVERVARRVLASVEKPLVLMNQTFYLSASIGAAIAPEDGSDAAMLLKYADSAMYRVKSDGRNGLRFFAGDAGDTRGDQLKLSSELPGALRRNEIELHYQPIVDVAGRALAGFEALMRWRHPSRGLLGADQFLAHAEPTGFLRELGLWAIRRALEDRAAIGIDRFPEAAVSVNVCARQFADERLPELIAELLAKRSIPARLLRLELTESAFVEDPTRTASTIEALRALGVRVIIDHFGTGYASFAHLRQLPVDGVKIAPVFICKLQEDAGNAAIVEAVSTLAMRLGIEVMAEGVETAAELKALRRFECHQLQGALIAEPMTLPALRAFLESLPAVREMHLVTDRPRAA